MSISADSNQGVSVSEDITKGKKRKRSRMSERIVYHVDAGRLSDHATPQHAAADGYQREMARPECDKAISPANGNPYGEDYSADRLSEPLTAGHAAPSAGDHGVGQGRNPEIAAHHPSLNQQSRTVLPWQTLRSVNGDNQFGDRDITHPRGTAVVQQLQVQHPDQFTSQPSGNPNVRAADHSARNSATPSNGTHVASGNVTSNAVKSSALDIMKAALFGDKS
jgi:hypothetical protein